MTDAIDTAWLLSIPFVLYFAIAQVRELFAPRKSIAPALSMRRFAGQFCAGDVPQDGNPPRRA